MDALRRSIRLLFALALLCVAGMAIYALFADLPLPARSVVIELPLPPEQ